MKFEVNKFLALTAVLATAAAAAVGCSATDAKKTDTTEGGSGGSSGSSNKAGAGGKEESAGAAGATEAAAGQGGASEGGAGGASEGGAAGATTEACIGDVVGAGGAADEGFDPCAVWAADGVPDCGAEDGNYAWQECSLLQGAGARANVIAAFNACATKLTDTCDVADVYECAHNLLGKACVEADTATNCALIKTACDTNTNCASVLDLVTPELQGYYTECIDPASEFYVAYDGTCDEQLLNCANLLASSITP